MLYHLVWAHDWLASCQDGQYTPASLGVEGFIHLSPDRETARKIANQFFPNQEGATLLLLALDPAKIPAEVRWEDVGLDRPFPHAYGPIPLGAVIAEEVLVADATGWKLLEP